MGKIKHPEPVKLFVGFITNETALIEKAGAALLKKFGPIDTESSLFDFDFTEYYSNEFGQNLKRKFITFKKLIKPDNINKVKILTNKIEKVLSAGGNRRINIDPGYVSLSKLVLLTTKDYYHRLYLGKGIYAEVTLYYKNRTFQSFDWSYPDYKTKECIDLLNKIREGYAHQLKQNRC